MSVHRFASPTSLVGILILFALPWVETSCTNTKTNSTSTVEVSGLQLALGGATRKENGRVVQSTIGRSREVLDKQETVAQYSMLTYGAVVLGALFAAQAMPNTLWRPVVIIFASAVAIGMLVLVTINCLSELADPMKGNVAGPNVEYQFHGRYLPSYYASYVLHFVTIVLCMMEIQGERKRALHSAATK